MIKTRPGIVLTHICGQYILVAAIEAQKYCVYTTALNETGAVIWKCLSDNKTVLDTAEILKNHFDIPKDVDINSVISSYINELHSHGYLIYEGDL